MAQVIIYTNENGGVSVCVPTGELPIEQVLDKDCPAGSIIIDDSQLPADKTFFDAWVLNSGLVTIDETKKSAIQAKLNAKTIALEKLSSLGLTENDLAALGIR
jgi:hypothetical protein